MLVRAHALEAKELLHGADGDARELAERHLDWPLPGYTHLQRAQPVYLSHHLLAYFWKFRRDLQRFNFCLTATDDLPLGAGALAGVNFDTEPRCSWRRSWASPGIAENSLDAVSNRDFVLDYLSAAATCADAPVAARRGDRALVEPRSSASARSPTPSPRGRASCPRRRTRTPPSSCARRRRGWSARLVARPRRPPRAAAHLQQGPPGGQGAALRRDRHASSCASRVAREMLAGDRVRPRAHGRRRVGRVHRRHRRGRRARAPGRAVPRGARDRRRARARRRRARQAAVRADRRRAGRARAAARRRRLPRAARAAAVARVEGLARAAPRWRACASSSRRRGTCWTTREAVAGPRRGFYDRSVHEVARDLIGCVVRHGETAGRIVETESYHQEEPACHAYVGLTRAHAHAVRAARARLRLLLVRHPRAAERGVPSPRASGAAVLIRALEPLDGHRPHARAPRARAPRGRSARARASSPRRSAIGLELNGDLAARRPDRDPRPRRRRREPRVVTGERIGITKAADLPWRFCDADSRHVSRPLAGGDAPAAGRPRPGATPPPPSPPPPPGPGAGVARRRGRRGGVSGAGVGRLRSRRLRRRRRPRAPAAARRLGRAGRRARPRRRGARARSPVGPGATGVGGRSRRPRRVLALRRVARWSRMLDPGRVMKSCQISAGNVPPATGPAVVLGLHRTELVRVADPDGDGQLLVEADEPGVAVVLGGAGLAGGELARSARPCRCRR